MAVKNKKSNGKKVQQAKKKGRGLHFHVTRIMLGVSLIMILLSTIVAYL